MAGGHTSWLVGGGILVLGAAAAMPFYRGGPGAADSQTSSSLGGELQWDGDPLTLRLPGTELPSSAPHDARPTDRMPLEELQEPEPPALHGEYGGLLNKFEKAKSPQQISSDPAVRALSIAAESLREPAKFNVERTNAESIDDTDIPSSGDVLDRQADLELDEDAAEMNHFIVDGDTLERISQRYYNDPFYATDIFERNRDVLSDPRLLPVGKSIVIPSRQSVAEAKQQQLEPIHDVGDLVPIVD